MNKMNKRLSLWQKLKIKYRYHWMDIRHSLLFPQAALPTWFMTHSPEKIQRRQAAFEAQQEQVYREHKELMELLMIMSGQMMTEKSLHSDNTPSSIS